MFKIPHLILFTIYVLLGSFSFFAITRVSKQFQIALIFCGLVISLEGLSLYLSVIGKGNYLIVLIQVLTYVGTFFWFSSFNLSAELQEKRMFFFELFLLMWFFGLYGFQNGIWPSLIVLYFSMCIILLSLLGLLNLLKSNSEMNVLSSSLFWFYGSNFGFYCFSIMLFSLRALERFNLKNNLHNDLIIYGNIILYLGLLNSVRLEIKNNRPL